MQSIDLIRDNLNKSRDRVLARVEEMREHCVVFPTRNGGCHTLWTNFSPAHNPILEPWRLPQSADG
jgi:hypothetical protein